MTYYPKTNKKWRVDREQGVCHMVDPGPARDRIAELVAAGWSQKDVAAAAGVSASTISIIVRGRYARVRAEVAAAILGLLPTPLPSRADQRGLVSSTGTRRRLQAMHADGWTLRDIEQEAGCCLSWIGPGKPRVTRATHDAVAAAYRALAGRQGPSRHTALRAVRRGWLGSVWWDDDGDLDDPAYWPPTARDRGTSIDAIAALAARGVPLREIAARLNVKAGSVARRIDRLPDTDPRRAVIRAALARTDYHTNPTSHRSTAAA